MKINLSKNVEKIKQSVTLEITAIAQEMKDKGINVISFGAGEPDFKTPDNISKKGIKSIEDGHTKYTAASGVLELKKAICDKLLKDNDLEYKPENIIVSNGAKHSLYNIFLAILDSGDEVIVPKPFWVSYPEIVSICGGVPVYVNLKEENDFKYDIDDLKKVVSKKTKAIIINSPNNPTGSVYDRENLEKIAKFAEENNLVVISDEIYEKLIYEGEHISIASLSKDLKDRTLVVNGMSKAYSMTGWRIGYVAGPVECIKAMSNLQSHTTSNPSSISQQASIEALVGSQYRIEEMRLNFKKRRDYMVDTINSIEGLSCKKPKGAFYVMVNISKVKGKTIGDFKIESSIDFCKMLLENASVAVVPGIAFGTDDFVRMSYAISMDNIKEGLNRIKNVLA